MSTTSPGLEHDKPNMVGRYHHEFATEWRQNCPPLLLLLLHLLMQLKISQPVPTTVMQVQKPRQVKFMEHHIKCSKCLPQLSLAIPPRVGVTNVGHTMDNGLTAYKLVSG